MISLRVVKKLSVSVTESSMPPGSTYLRGEKCPTPMTTRWPREWWILLWFCSFPLEFSKERNDQKSHAKTRFRPRIRLVVFSYTFQLALDQKPGSNSQIWNLDFPNNFFLRSGSLTEWVPGQVRGRCEDGSDCHRHFRYGPEIGFVFFSYPSQLSLREIPVSQSQI